MTPPATQRIADYLIQKLYCIDTELKSYRIAHDFLHADANAADDYRFADTQFIHTYCSEDTRFRSFAKHAPNFAKIRKEVLLPRNLPKTHLEAVKNRNPSEIIQSMKDALRADIKAIRAKITADAKSIHDEITKLHTLVIPQPQRDDWDEARNQVAKSMSMLNEIAASYKSKGIKDNVRSTYATVSDLHQAIHSLDYCHY